MNVALHSIVTTNQILGRKKREAKPKNRRLLATHYIGRPKRRISKNGKNTCVCRLDPFFGMGRIFCFSPTKLMRCFDKIWITFDFKRFLNIAAPPYLNCAQAESASSWDGAADWSSDTWCGDWGASDWGPNDWSADAASADSGAN